MHTFLACAKALEQGNTCPVGSDSDTAEALSMKPCVKGTLWFLPQDLVGNLALAGNAEGCEAFWHLPLPRCECMLVRRTLRQDPFFAQDPVALHPHFTPMLPKKQDGTAGCLWLSED